MSSLGVATPWNIAFSTSPMLNFGLQEAENKIAERCDPLKHRFLDFAKLHFVTDSRQKRSSHGWSHLKHRFLDRTLVAFFAAQKAKKKKFVSRGKPVTHRLLVLTQFEFCNGRKAENAFAELLDLLKHQFLDLAQVSFWAVLELKISSQGHAIS
jgi:hypothetical protein